MKNSVKVFDLKKQTKEVEVVEIGSSAVNAFAQGNSPEVLLTGNENGSIGRLDLREGKHVFLFKAHPCLVSSMSYNENCGLLVTGGVERRWGDSSELREALSSSVRVWDLRMVPKSMDESAAALSCNEVFTISERKFDESIFDVEFSAEGKFITVSGADSCVKIFQY